jgi:hypothetical protein
MKSYEDFDFASPLPPREVLTRLGRHTYNPGDGTFYGQVFGSNFKLKHDYGKPRDDSDDPEITGYVVWEGEGSRIYLRIHTPEQMYIPAKFGWLIPLFMLTMLILFPPSLKSILNTDYDIWLVNPDVIYSLFSVIATPIIAWRYVRKFKREGKNVLISKLVEYLDAGFPEEPDLRQTLHSLEKEMPPIPEKELRKA